MTGWSVWGELCRRTHIELVWAFLTGQRGLIEDLGDGRRLITIDARLPQTDRRATLAHELVHDERDILFTDDTPVALIVKEEAYVCAETARRLVPLDELDGLVRSVVLDGGAVGWWEVAEWFDVPRHVAENALAQLQQKARRRHPSA